MDKQPQPWPPYYDKDCSQGYCSYYCPQWCFFYFPPPPPNPPTPTHPLLSPLLISIIAIASTAFVLLAYYIILSRYRAHRNRSSGPAIPLHPAHWHVSHHDGLDETLIDKIAIHQYQTGGSLALDGLDCPVCLSQFEDGDGVRLLPKCGHAFHVPCIDTWLKSHSNCPLCRAGIFPIPACNNNIAIVVPEEENQESELDEIVEINGEGRGVLGRSLSMDSLFRRQTDTNTDAGSSIWSGSLHSVSSPVRMKRTRSMGSAIGRGSRNTVTLLPT